MIYLLIFDTEDEKSKFLLMYEKYRYLMQTVAYDVLNDYQLSEDIVHEAFVKVAQNMGKIKDINDNRTKRYLITITKNLAIDQYRKNVRERKNKVFIDELNEVETPVVNLESEMENKYLTILKELPEGIRDVFLLKYSSQFENSEIAEIMNISEENVRQRLSRGKKLIQKSLDDIGESL